MLDYYSSFTKSKDEIYREIISRFPSYNDSYIRSMIDHLYETDYITEEISITGWEIFIGHEVESKIKEILQNDLHKSKLKLLLIKCLYPRNDCCLDIIELISHKI